VIGSAACPPPMFAARRRAHEWTVRSVLPPSQPLPTGGSRTPSPSRAGEGSSHPPMTGRTRWRGAGRRSLPAYPCSRLRRPVSLAQPPRPSRRGRATTGWSRDCGPPLLPAGRRPRTSCNVKIGSRRGVWGNRVSPRPAPQGNGETGFPHSPTRGRVWEGAALPGTTLCSLRRCAAEPHGRLK